MSFLDKKPTTIRLGGREILYCTKCLMPNTRPRIEFDEKGVCNACRYAEVKFDGIDWAERQQEFHEILNNFRSKDGSWDCVIPWSGGKDSSSIAYKLKYEYNMNPLLVTFSPMLPNEVGDHNREALIKAGFDHILLRPDQKTQRILARRFFIERGNPKVAWDAGINVSPVLMALKMNIKLVFYAEHGETEYGGKVIHKDSSKIRDFTEVIEHQIGDNPLNWITPDVPRAALNPYIYPPAAEVLETGIKAYYFSYFNKWSMFENFKYIQDKIDFRTAPTGRTSGTFTDFDSLDDKFDPLYYYMQYIKFGFGRCVRDTSRFVSNNQMNRKEAIEHCINYDHEFPSECFDEILEYLDLDKNTFHEIVDKHRNDEIWKNENGEWKLRYPLPKK